MIPQLLNTAMHEFPWDRFDDIGGTVFRAFALVLWVAFMSYMIFSVVRAANTHVLRRTKHRSREVSSRRPPTVFR